MVYIHYKDIVSRPCKIELSKLSQQVIDMYTSIKDDNMKLKHPKCNVPDKSYTGFKDNDDKEPKTKKQVVMRPGHEPSVQCIAARNFAISSRRTNKTPMQILQSIDFGSITVEGPKHFVI